MKTHQNIAPLTAIFILGMFLTARGSASGSAEPAPAAHDAAPAESEASAHEEAAPVPTATPAPQFKLGPALNGFFDLNVFRATQRVEALRQEISSITLTLHGRPAATLNVKFALEFGTESGLAEFSRNEAMLMEEAQSVIAAASVRSLMTASGKRRLKDELIAVLNRKLRTAQVREIYFTEFCLSRA